MQTNETRHMSKREKKVTETDTRASKKTRMANIKRAIAETDKKSELMPQLKDDHTAACRELRKGKR